MDLSFLLTQSFWIKTLELMLALSILVVFHELGHYSFARLFGVWVEKFYMFFNYKFSLVKWKPGKYLKWFSHGKEMGSISPETRAVFLRPLREWRSCERYDTTIQTGKSSKRTVCLPVRHLRSANRVLRNLAHITQKLLE